MIAIRIDYSKRQIILSSAFEKRAFIAGTEEYLQLQAVRRDYPDFALVTREFKTNTKQDRHKGLSYPFMREYIASHEKNPQPVLDALEEMIGISKGHSQCKRYPTIKKWFLERYPDYAKFGMTEEELAKWQKKQAAASKSNNVTKLPASEDTPLPEAG